MAVPVVVELSAVIVTVSGDTPRILTVGDALPYGPLDPECDPTLGLALRRLVREQTGLELDYIEQLYTFGDRGRDSAVAARALSVAYLALVRQGRPFESGDARWRDWYGLFPWEDWRLGRPAPLERAIASALDRWVETAGDPATRRLRRARVDATFGLGGSRWDEVPALERYELLYEAGLVAEARRAGRAPPGTPNPGPEQLVEALAGARLHKQNFRRLVERGRLVEGTGRYESRTGGRPAELFRFRQEVLCLAAARRAVILAHNYQVPWIQDVADHVGDSLALSRAAAASDAEVIVFCGVHFMAETAKILAPDRTVLIP